MTWRTANLKQLAALGPQYGANASAVPRIGTRPRYVRITDIDSSGRLIPDGAVGADLENESDFLLDDGDLLFARSGNTVGKSYRYSKSHGPCVFAGYMIRFRLRPELADPRFVFYFTRSSDYQRWVSSKKRVAGQPNINGSEYSALTLPIPVLCEQRRIIDILDQADALTQKRAEADAFAERILPALFHKLFGDPAANPNGWRRTTLGNVLADASYGTSAPSNTAGDGLPVLRMNNIDRAGRIDLASLKNVVIEQAEAHRQLLRPGDLLFNRTNTKELVGKTGLWRGQMLAVAASYLIRLRVDESNVVPDYVWAWMNTPYFKQLLFAISRRAVGMANINATELGTSEVMTSA
ncbi:Restriction modification system DNA specificity domain-containing protein (fragment) [Verrucomicrobia bacterium]